MAVGILRSTLALTLSVLRIKASGIAPTKREINSGAGSMPSTNTTVTSGTGSLQVNQEWLGSRSILAGQNDDIDLYGSLIDDDGDVINFAKIKKIIVAIDDPDGTKKLRVGPQAVSNPFIGPWAGYAAIALAGEGDEVYEEVFEFQPWINSYAGWTVTAGTADKLRIHNPTASTITYTLYLEGVQ